jgi:hypothetical protein
MRNSDFVNVKQTGQKRKMVEVWASDHEVSTFCSHNISAFQSEFVAYRLQMFLFQRKTCFTSRVSAISLASIHFMQKYLY